MLISDTHFFSRFLLIIYVLGLCAISQCPASAPDADAVEKEAIPIYGYNVLSTYPHDRKAFTQGLVSEDGILYESTGLRGRSTLRKVELETGKVLQRKKLPGQIFAEGITIYGDKIIQLTWQSNIGFVYDKESFELLKTFKYPTEGWGITYNRQFLIMSDGTSVLHFLDAESFEKVGQIQIRDADGPVTRLNELEYVQEEIYANVWQSDRIARINPRTGEVTGWISLGGLLSLADYQHHVDVLNGIAYDSVGKRLFVTGKLWPRLFEIELVRK